MGLFGIKWFGTESKKEVTAIAQAPQREMNASVRYGASFVMSFDGEKNPGEIGPVIQYVLDTPRLRLRSWQAYLESEIARTVLDRYFIWVINKGLKLQCAPVQEVLRSEGIDLDAEKFNTTTEARFSVWSKSKKISFNGMKSLNDIAKDAMRNATVGGDCLVILRYDLKKGLTVQLIDGAHVCSPLGITTREGNRVIDGVELDASGRHVAYHVSQKVGETERILAWSESTGLRTAFMVYGSKYRLDDVRGLPRISTSLESLKKIERYKEAAVGSAEERAKIVYSIVHNQFSDGSSPLLETLGGLMNADGGSGTPNAQFTDGETVASAISASTNKQTFNMPIGAKLEAMESKQEMFFKEFYSTNADVICATIGIPPNVAFSMYNDSFSASRAATKDWENTIDFERDDFKCQFYDPIFAFWLHLEVLDFKIQAPGYLVAFNKGNWMVTESYLNNRFVGPMFPHIDPLKEVEAERLKLGTLAAAIPLTTVEQSTEFLSGGESTSNIEQFAEELKKATKLGIKVETLPPAPTPPAKPKPKEKV